MRGDGDPGAGVEPGDADPYQLDDRGDRSGHDTHATHVRCVESGRWNAWGSRPTPNSPAAARAIARGAPAVRRYSQRPVPATRKAMTGSAKNHRNS